MEMSPNLLFVLGIVASALVFLLREIFVKRGQDVPAWVYTVAVGVVSLLLAIAFTPIVLPPFPAHDGSLLGVIAAVLAYLAAVLPVVSSIVGFATVIYQALLKKILEGLSESIKAALAGPKGSNIG